MKKKKKNYELKRFLTENNKDLRVKALITNAVSGRG